MFKEIQFAAVLALTLCCGLAYAANPALPNGPYLIANGDANIQVAPDTAYFTFVITDVAKTAADATNKQAPMVKVVLKAAESVGINEKDIEDSAISVSPYQEYDKQKVVYVGVELRRSFGLTLRNIKNYSALMTALLNANVDNLDNVQFSYSKASELKDQLMDQAIDDAHRQAIRMAHKSGAALGHIYAVASSEYSGFISDGMPGGSYGGGAYRLRKVEVTGSRISSPLNVHVPETINLNVGVVAVYTMKPN